MIFKQILTCLFSLVLVCCVLFSFLIFFLNLFLFYLFLSFSILLFPIITFLLSLILFFLNIFLSFLKSLSFLSYDQFRLGRNYMFKEKKKQRYHCRKWQSSKAYMCIVCFLLLYAPLLNCFLCKDRWNGDVRPTLDAAPYIATFNGGCLHNYKPKLGHFPYKI